MQMNRSSVLMLSALLMPNASASSLADEKLITQRMMSSKNSDNANLSPKQLLDQMRQHRKSMNERTTAAVFQIDNQNERRIQVVTKSQSSLRVPAENPNRMLLNSVQRKLPMTGHIWDACLPDSTPTNEEITAATFDSTAYDDELNPFCTCLYDPQVEQLWLQCAMGDEECKTSASNATGCQETHEIFVFSQNTGDLSIKNTCNFCTDWTMMNCEGIKEICSVVYFDDNETPEQCFFQELLSDGKLNRCENCQICTDSVTGALGMNYDCFDGAYTTNGQCDTTQSFHVHNFAPVTSSGPNPIGGRFGDLCRKNEEFAIYDKTTYDEPYSKVCDCDDPTAGVIVCDLFFQADFCFANECSPISEIFYFGEQSGELTEKLTCDGTNGLCSSVTFDQNDGTPSTCEVILFPDPTPCTACNICQDENTNAYGIQFSCFGSDQTQCLTSNGRAVNNFVDQPTSPPNVSGTISPVAPPTGEVVGPPTTPNMSEDPEGLPLAAEQSTPWGPILGAFFGGLALSGLAAYACSRKNKTEIEATTGAGEEVDPPVDEAHEDEVDEIEPPKEVPTLT